MLSDITGLYPDAQAKLIDITARSNQMGRNSAILYPRTDYYEGLTVLETGQRFWIKADFRICKGRVVIELSFTERRGS